MLGVAIDGIDQVLIDEILRSKFEALGVGAFPSGRAQIAGRYFAFAGIELGDLAEIQRIALAGIAAEIVDDAAADAGNLRVATGLPEREVVNRSMRHEYNGRVRRSGPRRRVLRLRRHDKRQDKQANGNGGGAQRHHVIDDHEPISLNSFWRWAPACRFPLADVLFAVIAAKIGQSIHGLQQPPRCQQVGDDAAPPLAWRQVIGEEKASPTQNLAAQAEEPMAGMVEKKLQELGIALQEPRAPMANYVPFVRTGDLLHVSGQICLDGDGKLVAKGRLGDDVSVEGGQKAARVCAINLLAQVKAALGDLDKVKRVVRLGGFINSAAGFTEGPKVMNGASDLMVAVFGDKGKHARSTVGVAALPADAAVEVEGLFEVS